jgi:hypothetical protein
MGTHQETPLNINLEINNERQDHKIGTAYVELLVEEETLNERD